MIRIRLLKQYKHIHKAKPWPIGQILQLSPYLASELIGDGIGELYTGEYPPKPGRENKMKTDFFKPKNK